MRRATPAVAVLPIILATLALGCGQAQPRWVKTVEVSGIIDHTHANQRFRDGRYIGLDVKSGGNVRFVVATGGVEGFTGPIHQPQFYYELLPVTQTLLSPPPVKMSVKVTTKSVN